MENLSHKKQELIAEKPKQLVSKNSGISLEDNRPQSTIQKKANNTGLPNQLKSGIENLSGHSMDDVKVHYNSSKPAQLNAHAYAQGTDIHVASGQEKHLPHEAWHVVQQKQGRVKPTMQLKAKVNINDDKSLEKEADMMGARALQLKEASGSSSFVSISSSSAGKITQRAFDSQGQILHSMQEVAQNDQAWAFYQGLDSETKELFRANIANATVRNEVYYQGFMQNMSKKSAQEVISAMRRELAIWYDGVTDVPRDRRFDTGYNGNGRPNAVISLDTLATLQAHWKRANFRIPPGTAMRDAYSNTNGARTGKRMHDFLVENQDPHKAIFNFHIEVVGRVV
jgi:hypothetical protein